MEKEKKKPQRIEPEEMLDYLSEHIVHLMDDGVSGAGLIPLLEFYFEHVTKKED